MHSFKLSHSWRLCASSLSNATMVGHAMDVSVSDNLQLDTKDRLIVLAGTKISLLTARTKVELQSNRETCYNTAMIVVYNCCDEFHE